MILIIDNYDSFVYNIVQRVGELGHNSEVVRCDEITVDRVKRIKPSHIIISPGPKTPKDYKRTNTIIKTFAPTTPQLGICLGHQCIAEVFGGRISKNIPVHGKEDTIYHDDQTIFSDLPQGFIAGRYHSLHVTQTPSNFEISARNKERMIMGIRHKKYKLEGIQFHPESIITTKGYEILKNFLHIT